MDERPISSHCRRNGLRRFKRPRCLSASFTRACFFGYHIQQKKEVETCGFISLTLISTCLVLLPHWYLVRCPGLWEDTGNLSLNGWAICQPPSNSKSGMHTHLSYLQGKGVIFDREILPALVNCVTWTHTLSVFKQEPNIFLFCAWFRESGGMSCPAVLDSPETPAWSSPCSWISFSELS
jgi:hypothetical protein